ncbi:MAG: polyribonucleotide nucleotidyltransferase [Spirochaetes bacterium]|nr:polyribonucleotide nucleotidyltransferase [Spirochaetota bacterium]
MYSFEKEVDGKKMIFQTGDIARQADGAVLVQMGETIVLATVVASRESAEGRDFFPLTVEYKEKFYASGKMPGGYKKREGRPSDAEVLVCRITDRPLRPLFPEGFINEVQIIISVIASDKTEMPDVLAINAASAALSIAGVPFHGPVGAVRVGRIDGKLICNPTFEQVKKSDIDLMVAGTEKAVTMIEGLSNNITEDEMLEAVVFAHENIKKFCEPQNEMKSKLAKEIIQYTPRGVSEELKNAIKEKYTADVDALNAILDKKGREDAFNALVVKVKSELEEQFPEVIGDAKEIIHDIDKDIVRKRILEGKRCDGRKPSEIRPITVQTGVLPRVHGSALFTRGQTQSLGVVTLGTERDAEKVDSMNFDEVRTFMLHYNFPPFSVGECGRVGGLGRREIGHGMLAERALTYAIPPIKEYPYSIRLVSEILESNGSSSMASVCSGSLAMMDAGIPLKSQIAGIAMGLVLQDGKHTVLSDIQGIEDHLGDMDFKVAGTSEGITAFQLDIKIEGITPEIMKEALAQAKEGRLHILNEMNKVISVPKSEMSPYAPRIKQLRIRTDKIAELIGPGGRNIRAIIEQTGAEINVNDAGEVVIYAVDADALERAESMVLGSTKPTADVEVGKIYDGIVKKVMEYGAFVEVLPGKEGLLHISKISKTRTKNVTDVLNEGDAVRVKVMNVERNGKFDLSRKDAMEEEDEGNEEQ